MPMTSINNPEIDITLRHAQWSEDIPEFKALIESAVCKTLDMANYASPEAELSIVLADNEFVQGLNKQWRGKDKPTNVLSFPQDEPGLLGDIILAYETVLAESELQNKDFADHTAHLLVHGLLHLLGHDHEEDHEAETMETLEISILQALNIKNPYKIQESVA